jgi:hypothetical protein
MAFQSGTLPPRFIRAASRIKLMLELTAYFDESGDANDPKCQFVGMGGLCAPADNWAAFDEKWRAILDDQSEGEWFHMELFAARKGVYEGWGESRRRKLLSSLVGTIKEANARPFGAVVSIRAYNYLARVFPGVENFFKQTYHLCFEDVTRAAAIQAMEHNWPFVEGAEKVENAEQVAMVYAQQKTFGAITSKAGTDRKQMGKAESLWYAHQRCESILRPMDGRICGWSPQ